MRSRMRWLMTAVLMAVGVQAARAQLVDPTTGVMVNATSDPTDFGKIASGQPGNIGTELAAQAAEQAQKDHEAAMKAADEAREAAMAFANAAAATPTSAAPTSGSPGSLPANSSATRPVITPRGGTFHVALGGSVLVTIREENPKAKIYYTTDGSRPTLDSAVYSGPIEVSQSETLKVLATGPTANASRVVTEKFKIKH